MKILIKPTKKIEEYQHIDGFILPLKDYSTDYESNYTLEEIIEIGRNTDKEIFIVMNRMIFNNDINELKGILKKIEDLKITGVFFYDLAFLKFKQEMNLKTDLVWNAPHMTTNYKTCNYYYDKGVKYASLSNEITLKEILEIREKSKITPMFTLISYPPVATSNRYLITNYLKMYNLKNKMALEIEEKITKEKYLVTENKFGTTFKYGKILNNIEALEKLKEVDFPYLVLIEDGIDHNTFQKILAIIDKNRKENASVDEIYSLVGNNTGFLNKETIYKVKKDE